MDESRDSQPRLEWGRNRGVEVAQWKLGKPWGGLWLVGGLDRI